jgi:hypothetical protein
MKHIVRGAPRLTEWPPVNCRYAGRRTAAPQRQRKLLENYAS